MRTPRGQRQIDILAVLNANNGPMTAYDILGALRTSEPKIAPPTVYRALSALMLQDRVHRLESLNAFVPCQCDHQGATPVLSICDDCGNVDELIDTPLIARLNAVAAEVGFTPKRHVVEMHGTCADCTP